MLGHLVQDLNYLAALRYGSVVRYGAVDMSTGGGGLDSRATSRSRAASRSRAPSVSRYDYSLVSARDLFKFPQHVIDHEIKFHHLVQGEPSGLEHWLG